MPLAKCLLAPRHPRFRIDYILKLEGGNDGGGRMYLQALKQCKRDAKVLKEEIIGLRERL
jgi:hypothetical protein